MRTWIKLYTEIIDDPKMGRLTDRQFRTCINLFALAGRIDTDGALPALDDIAWQFRMDIADLTADLQTLRSVHIIAEHDGQLVINRWRERQAKSPSAAPERVLQRVTEYRQRRRNDDVTTLHEEVNRGVTPIEQNRKEKNKEEVAAVAAVESLAWKAFTRARGINLNASDSEYITELVDLYGDEAVAQAVVYCDKHKRDAFLRHSYIQKVLSGWQADGTLGQHATENGNGQGGRDAKRRGGGDYDPARYAGDNDRELRRILGLGPNDPIPEDDD